jgi:hypothetical protein
MNAVAGDCAAEIVDELQLNSAWLGTAAGAAKGLATGLGADNAAGEAWTAAPIGKVPVGTGRFALTANETPTATAATKTAATPTIRYDRLRSAVAEKNVFMPIGCSQPVGWLQP